MPISTQSSLKPRILIQENVHPAEHLRGTPILVAAFKSGDDFLHAYEDEGPAGELALVTRAKPRSGRGGVVLEVTWPDLPNSVFLRAKVVRRRLGLLARIHADDAPARDFLVQMAAGDRVRYHLRKHRRYCVRLSVEWRCFGSTDMASGEAEDLSTSGVLIATCAPLPARLEKVAIRLRGAAGQDLVVTGEVRHARLRDRDGAFGVQFAYKSSGEQRRLRQLLRVFAARGVVLLRQS